MMTKLFTVATALMVAASAAPTLPLATPVIAVDAGIGIGVCICPDGSTVPQSVSNGASKAPVSVAPSSSSKPASSPTWVSPSKAASSPAWVSPTKAASSAAPSSSVRASSPNAGSSSTRAASPAVVVSSSAPSATPSTAWSTLDQLARFDNADGLPIVAFSPINTYLDIFWQGMSLAKTAGLQNLAIVKPNSPDNYAAFSRLNLATLPQGQPAMTVNYPDSTIDHFDLNSFYYGCALSTQASVAGVPVSCTISIKGYSDDAGKQLVAEQSFWFSVGLLQLSTQMVKANVDAKFKGLKRVNFFVTNDLTTAALIDTVSYKVYSTKSVS